MFCTTCGILRIEGRNEVYFFVPDPIFVPKILIPDPENDENCNPRNRNNLLIHRKTLLVPIPRVVIPNPRPALIPDRGPFQAIDP